MNLDKMVDESEMQYLWRLGSGKDSGLIDLSWNDLSNIINRNLYYDEADYLGESAYRKRYSYAKEMYNEVFSKMDCNTDISSKIRMLEKERKKLQTEKLEYNRWLREDARDEMIVDAISSAIKTLPRIDIPERISSHLSNKSYLLAFSDAHYGIEFSLKDLYGNTINEYSPEIFENRMAVLLSRCLDIIENEGIDELSVFDLGDGIQGILRLNSQLMKLKYGIVDGTVRYAYFLANWLNVLSQYVRIKFQMVKDSNHTQIRICDAPKNAFPEENMNKVMVTIIKLVLKDNPNVEIIENPTGFCYSLMSGWSVLGTHGEQKNLSRAIDDFSRVYNTHIDYYIGGHKHHSGEEEVSNNREAIVIRSLIGTDPYALSLNKVSNAGASLLCFEQTDGLIQEYKIKL